MADAQLSFRKSANIDRVTDKRKDSLFRLVDTDGSGTIDAQEFAVLYDAIKKDLAEELEKEAALAKEASSAKRRFKMLLLFVAVLLSFLAASVAANFAVIFTVVDSAISTTTTSTGLLEVKGSDTIVKTAIATQDLPLVAAPALDMETLSQVKSLTVKYESDDGNYVAASLSVVAARKHNTTFVEFVTDVPGETVETLNGVASLVRYPTRANGLPNPQKYTLCSANATCSAFRASGIDADAVLELAAEALVKGGFLQETRQLYGVLGCSYDPNDPNSITYNANKWQFYIPCGASSSQSGYPSGGCDTIGTANLAISNIYTLWYKSFPGRMHFVFFAHGLSGSADWMWDYYCDYGATTCPDLTIPAFTHLIFIWATSTTQDSTYSTNGWGTATSDHNTYSVGGMSLAAMMCDISPTGSLSSILSGPCNNGLWHQAPLQTTPPADVTWPWGLGQSTIDASSEIMIIGFSNGGGLGVYMNWAHGGKVTKTVSMDYWAYAYSAQPTSFINTITPTAVNMHIYANCDAGYYAPPSTPTPYAYTDAEAMFSTPSLWFEAGLALNGGAYTTGATYALASQWPNSGSHSVTSYDYTDWYYDGPKGSILFSAHGFDTSTMLCTANVLTQSVTSHGWPFNSPHGDVPLFASITDDITKWISPAPPPPSPPPPLPPSPVASPSPTTGGGSSGGGGTVPQGYCGWDPKKFWVYFQQYDYDGSGCLLLYGELTDMIIGVFGPTTLRFAVPLYPEYDCDGNGCLDPVEAWYFFQKLFQFSNPLSTGCDVNKCIDGRWDKRINEEYLHIWEAREGAPKDARFAKAQRVKGRMLEELPSPSAHEASNKRLLKKMEKTEKTVNELLKYYPDQKIASGKPMTEKLDAGMKEKGFSKEFVWSYYGPAKPAKNRYELSA